MLVAGGSTNVTTYFALRLTADGTAATALTITNFDLQYVRSGVAPVAKVDATALAATDSVHADNKAIEIDATDQPGLYRVDWPDAAFAAGVREVILTVKVATAFTEHLRVEIDGEVNVVEWAGTDVVAGAIPAVAADGAGGLPISDAGGLDLDTQLAATNEVTAARMGALTDWIDGGRLDLLLDAIPTTAMRGTNGANTTTPPTVGAIADQVWEEAQAGHVAAGSFGVIASEIAAIPTTAMRGTDSAALASVCTEGRLAELDAANLPSDVDAILVDTGTTLDGRIPAALVGGRMDADVGAISTSTAAADNLEASAEVIVTGAAEAGTLSTTQMTSDLAEATDDHYNGRIIIWTSGVLLGQATDITDYAGATGLLTFTGVTEAPSAADAFVIV